MDLLPSFQEAWSLVFPPARSASKVVVGVSGGLDSVVLLHLLSRVLPTEHLVVAHLDHQTRPESAGDAEWVRCLCESWKISHCVISQRGPGKISENAMRIDRLAFLKQVQKETLARGIVLGHHADDQVETLLMRLIRGTRLEGLGGMKAKNGALLRPLLNFTKAELLAYAQKHRLQWREDNSNQDPTYLRNRLRKELVPLLHTLSGEFGGQKAFTTRIEKLAREAQTQSALNQRRARNWLSEKMEDSRFWLKFSRLEWLQLNRVERLAVAQTIWKTKFQDSLETRDFDFLNQAIEAQKRSVLSGEILVTVSFNQVFFEGPEQLLEQQRALQTPSQLLNSLVRGNQEQWLHWLGEENAEVRFLQPGDRYLGKKMKRRCWEHKIPRTQRKLLPVIASRGRSELLWHYPLPNPGSFDLNVFWLSQQPQSKNI